FSPRKWAFLIFSGRVPLARFQNRRNGGSSGSRRNAIAGRLSGLPPPRALRRGARREVRLRVVVIASAQRAAWKKREAVACGTRLVGSYPSPANQILAKIDSRLKYTVLNLFEGATRCADDVAKLNKLA